MKYDYHCESCDKTFELEISINEYDKVKDKQLCPNCNVKMTRVLSWNGFAMGKGSGWCGKSTGSII
jgi:putative FmdB family regulatory protein